MHILLIDNYDSFTYNLAHMLEDIPAVDLDVIRNTHLKLDALETYDGIVISPGPGIPEEAGLLMPFLEQYADKLPIFGVCLGHQAIGQYFGGSLKNTPKVYHGISSPVNTIIEDGILKNIGAEFEAARYHSWIVNEEELPDDLEVTARTHDGVIMAMRHKTYPIQSVQFHPESILTPKGKIIIENWTNSLK